MALRVASVHEVSGGKITRWCDYWDMSVLAAAAPQWWFEHVVQGWK
jgi:limonene-1,2-epoxide hydrolase